MMRGAGERPTPLINTIIVRDDAQAQYPSLDAGPLPHLEFPLASGEARTMLEAFGVWVEKSMYGRTYVGTERTTVRDGTVAKVWPKVKVPGHAREVLETARAL